MAIPVLLLHRSEVLPPENSIKALDLKARDSIERLTTATAQDIADFLYERDNDILLAADIVESTFDERGRTASSMSYE